MATKTKFKKGDLVVGNAAASKAYGVTVKGWKGKVVAVHGDGRIEVKELRSSQTYVVRSSHFDLVKAAPAPVRKPAPKPTKTYSVDPKFIRDAHKAACSEWQEKIEKKFPEVFKPKETIYDFGNSHKLTYDSDGPLVIGFGLAPNELEGKCLVLNDGYKVEIKNHCGNQILVFKKVTK